MIELDRIRQSSQYLATLLRRPELEDWLGTRRNLQRRYPLTELYQDLVKSVREAASFNDLLLDFRHFKQRHFLRIGGRDLLGMADLGETTSQVADVACVALQVGLETLSAHPEWWLAEEAKDWWRQVRSNLRVVVMGLGKLGGQELNYVSDVDLLFLHDFCGDGDSVRPGDGVVTALSSLCQYLFRLFTDMVEGDRVFQADLRLRPRGKDGELVPSLAGAADYYLQHGRSWERQMLLKARAVAGDRSLGTAFLREVRPFIFRRFLDFQALDEIRNMRDKILREAVRPRPDWQLFDVKLGVGGIREIEFIVQSLQLIYGGRHPELDEPNTLRCLGKLKELKLLPPDAAAELVAAYTFLRRTEHWVQLDQNRQTQKLPRSPEARARLSLALGFEGDERGFLTKLEETTGIVHRHFLTLFHQGERADSAAARGDRSRRPMSERLGDLAGSFPGEAISRLGEHLKGFQPTLQEKVLDVLESFATLKDAGLIEKVPVRLERYISQVRRRPGLVKALESGFPWFEDLFRGLARSQLVADLLSQQPGLIEGFIHSPALCLDPPSWEAYGERVLAGQTDYEQRMEWIRRLKNERILQVLLSDLGGSMSHESVEEYLTLLADFVIRHTCREVLDNVGLPEDLPLAVLALGKLGSREMGYLSDLDLVFVYEPRPEELQDQIPPDVVRLVQRFMRMLSVPLQEGPGYSVDARLRPTGNYGPLIVTRASWEVYYADSADLWEIQALLRMRCVAGHPALCRRLEERALDICYRERDPEVVWTRLCHLRGRMQRERAGQETDDSIDIKLGIGGLTDIEFLVQGNLLVSGYRDRSLQIPSTRAALKGILSRLTDMEIPLGELQSAFEMLRSLEHRLRVCANTESSRLSPDQFESLCAMGLWPPAHATRPAETWQDILRLRRRVRAVLRHWCSDL